jgi:hypothetical protein
LSRGWLNLNGGCGIFRDIGGRPKMKYKSKEAVKNLEIYKEFNWQKVKKLADEIGVKFYSGSTTYSSNGLGFRINNYDKTKINIEGYVKLYNDNYEAQELRRVSKKLFWLKIELYFLKNNIQYVVSENEKYIQIIKEEGK